MNGPLVTVYMPCRDYGLYLTKAVDSVLAQLYSNWELFIINEGSSDNTSEIALTYVNKYPKQIRLINNKKAVGLQKLANDVLSKANGKYMLRLDADDWLDESALLIMVAKLEATQDVSLVYGNYFYTDSHGNVLGFERRKSLGEEDEAGFLPPHGACTMFRTRSLKTVGGYSEDIDAQDGWELWYKLYSRFGAASIDAPTFYYRQHSSSLSRNERRLLSARSKIFDKLSDALKGDYNPSSLAVIPVRKSYDSFTDVPFKIFDGMSFLQRSLIQASKCDNVNSIAVASSSEDVLEYSAKLEKQKLVPPHLRLLRTDNKEQNNFVPIQSILIKSAHLYADTFGQLPDIVSFLSLHAVKRQAKHIDDAINVLRLTGSDSVVSVEEEREPMFSLGKSGLSMLNPGRFQDLFYDRERLYRFNGSIISTWWETLNTHNLFGEKIAHIEMSQEDSLQIKSDKMLSDINKAD